VSGSIATLALPALFAYLTKLAPNTTEIIHLNENKMGCNISIDQQ
jgi:hypothetical protein